MATDIYIFCDNHFEEGLPIWWLCAAGAAGLKNLCCGAVQQMLLADMLSAAFVQLALQARDLQPVSMAARYRAATQRAVGMIEVLLEQG